MGSWAHEAWKRDMNPRDDELEDLIDNLDAAQRVFEAMSHADGCLALIFDRKKGWCATDLLTPLTFVDGRADEYKVSCPSDWHRERLTAAIAVLGLVHAGRPPGS